MLKTHLESCYDFAVTDINFLSISELKGVVTCNDQLFVGSKNPNSMLSDFLPYRRAKQLF